MSKKRYQTWLIPLSGSYFLTVEKGDYTKEEIEQKFHLEHRGHLHVPNDVDVISEDIEIWEEYEE